MDGENNGKPQILETSIGVPLFQVSRFQPFRFQASAFPEDSQDSGLLAHLPHKQKPLVPWW